MIAEIAITEPIDELLLIPTEIEAAIARPLLEQWMGSDWCGRVELCGCGPFLSAARSMQLIQQLAPRRVVLLGIAGRLVDEPATAGEVGAEIAPAAQLEIGCAYEFSEVACYGFGAGCGVDYRSAWELEWHRWPTPAELSLVERLPLQAPASTDRRLLLTSAAASGHLEEASWRLRHVPGAQAEDMESYSVATACRLAEVPLRVIRGISNQAGDRNHATWRVAEALKAAVQTWRWESNSNETHDSTGHLDLSQ